MNKKILVIIIVLLLAIAVVFIFRNKPEAVGISDYKNIEFTISGQPFTLANSSVKYFGNEARQDLDGDGAEDVAFLITHQPGGSGTFYYLVGALKRGNSYVGTKAVFIGDRISPQTTEKGPGRQVIVNYADRRPTDPMTAQPSVGKSLYLLLDTKTLEFGEVVQNFEGESR